MSRVALLHAGTYLHAEMTNYLATQMDVKVSVVDSQAQFQVTQQHHPDITARIRRFPGIHSIIVRLDCPVQHTF